MILDIIENEDVEVVFSYLPVWEMFFSMHVLSNPEHHAHRGKWIESESKRAPELVEKIKGLSELTNLWEIIIDAPIWNKIRQMEIVELISFLQKKDIYQWNKMIEYSGKRISVEERDEIVKVIKEYYNLIFRKEEIILRAYLTRILQEEKIKCLKNGIWWWCDEIHPRLCVEQDRIIYMKNREYQFKKKQINKIFASVSTFVEPHLWLYQEGNELEVVKGILVEQSKGIIPKDFMRVFRALGDTTRLELIKFLLQGICTTQELAKNMSISEAAISKHLKILSEAGLVRKTKKGHYVKYSFITGMIDFIPYTFYETMKM